MTHRQIIKAWLGNIHLPGGLVYDWGSGSKPAFRYIHYEDERKQFITIDNAPGIPEDRKGNLGHFDLDIAGPVVGLFEKSSYAFCLEVLEHVENPVMLISNIRRNILDGGILYLSAPFKYPIHADADYWRFTANGLRLLLERNGFEIIALEETIDELGYMVEARAI